MDRLAGVGGVAGNGSVDVSDLVLVNGAVFPHLRTLPKTSLIITKREARQGGKCTTDGVNREKNVAASPFGSFSWVGDLSFRSRQDKYRSSS